MAEVKRGALQSPANKARTSDTVVRHVQIIDANGAVQPANKPSPLVLTGGTAEDTQMAGMYYKTMGAGGDATFVLPVNSTNEVEIIDILYNVDSAVTLAVEVQALAQGAANWQPIPAYTTGAYAADGTSQYLNSAFPLRHILGKGNQYRVVCTVGDACDVGVQVMGVVL